MRRRRAGATASVLLVALATLASLVTISMSQVHAQEDPDDPNAGLRALGAAALAFVSDPELEADIVKDLVFGDWIQSLRDEALTFNLVRGEDVTYDSDIVDTATIAYTFSGVINTGTEPVEMPYDPDVLEGYAGSQRSERSGSSSLPPFLPPDTPLPGPDQIDGTHKGGPMIVGALTDEMGIDPLGRTMFDGEEFVYVSWPEDPPEDSVLDELTYFFGVRTVEPRTLECPGLRRSSGVVFDTPAQNFDETTFPNLDVIQSYNEGADTKIVVNCTDESEPGPVLREVFLGPDARPAFSEDPAASALIMGSYGWILIVPGSEIADATSVRWYEFITDATIPFDVDKMAASAYPGDLSTLLPLSSLPHTFYDESLIVAPTTTTVPPTTTTTIAAAVTTIAASAPSSVASDTTSTQVALAPPIDTESAPGGFPFPLLIFTGLALMGLGGYVWWNTWSNAEPATVGGGGSDGTTPEGTTHGAVPGVVIGTRPGKGVGGGEDSPPRIGLRGWRP